MLPSLPAPARRLRLAAALAVGAAAALPAGAAGGSPATPGTASGLPVQVTFAASTTPATAATVRSWTVPPGVSEVTFYVNGGAGGSGGADGGPGGGGGAAQADLAVTAGETFSITVGGQGADGADPQSGMAASGGVGGAPGGGRGGSGDLPSGSLTGALGGGGGGGGASTVSLPAGGETSLVLVAPGGGGGGAGSGALPAPQTVSAGGAGGLAGSGDDVTADGGGAGTATGAGAGGNGTPPGATGTSTGGGDAAAGSGAGGGGDGFFGGGSGGGGTVAGGGGGGAFYVGAATTDYFQLPAATGASVSVGYATPAAPPPAPTTPAPHPAIVGTPALGEPLTCLPTTTTAGETFSYRWLRDLAEVSGATGQSYTVAPADPGHYLQCVVTATTSAGTVSGTSGFVTVPVQGAPAAILKTTFTAAAHAAGARLVVRCSPRAAGSCLVTVLLSTTETLRSGRVVGVAASAPAHRPARVTHRTVIVGTASVRLAPGASRAVLAPLNALGRRLLAQQRRLPVLITANGTLIGATTGSLGSAHVTLRARAARRRR